MDITFGYLHHQDQIHFDSNLKRYRKIISICPEPAERVHDLETQNFNLL